MVFQVRNGNVDLTKGDFDPHCKKRSSFHIVDFYKIGGRIVPSNDSRY